MQMQDRIEIDFFIVFCFYFYFTSCNCTRLGAGKFVESNPAVTAPMAMTSRIKKIDDCFMI